nr:unnamed protein product [Callosobruchus chinensis]
MSVFVRMFYNDFTIKEEVLKMLPLTEQTTGQNFRGLVLKSFNNVLCAKVKYFKQRDETVPELKNEIWLRDFGFLVDIAEKLRDTKNFRSLSEKLSQSPSMQPYDSRYLMEIVSNLKENFKNGCEDFNKIVSYSVDCRNPCLKMKCFIAALSALLAVASAVPIYDVNPSMTAGPLGGYGDVMDRRAIRTIGDPALTCLLQPLSYRCAVGDLSLFYRYMSSDLTGIRGAYNPMYMLWAGFGGVSSSDMGLYGPYSSLYRHYGLMGIGNDWDLHQSIKMNWYPDVWNYGVHGSGLVGDMYSRICNNLFIFTMNSGRRYQKKKPFIHGYYDMVHII